MKWQILLTIGVKFMMIFSITCILLTVVVYFTFFKKEKSVAKGTKPTKRETKLDKLQKERVKKEIENFLNYNGDEQPEIK